MHCERPSNVDFDGICLKKKNQMVSSRIPSSSPAVNAEKPVMIFEFLLIVTMGSAAKG